jgi:hypothetical protein
MSQKKSEGEVTKYMVLLINNVKLFHNIHAYSFFSKNIHNKC